jgi:hypothetical protein
MPNSPQSVIGCGRHCPILLNIPLNFIGIVVFIFGESNRTLKTPDTDSVHAIDVRESAPLVVAEL